MNGHFDPFGRVGAIEYHDTQTSVLACLAAFLRFCGLPVRLDHLIDIAPIPQQGADAALLAFIGRRLGIALAPVEAGAQAQWRQHEVLMARNARGYWCLLWPADDTSFLAGLPGLAGSFRRLPASSGIVETIAAVYALGRPARALRLQRALRPPRLWLLPWQPCYAGPYDSTLVERLRSALAARNIEERAPGSLAAMTPHALRQAHRSLVRGASPIHGTYRTINMRRGDTLFVDYRAVAPAVEMLLARARRHRPTGVGEAIDFSARLFADFLSIHPFLNGNRRMAILLVAYYLSPWDVAIDWSRVKSSQHNYWMRCTQRGHFSVLRQGFHAHVAATGTLPPAGAPSR